MSQQILVVEGDMPTAFVVGIGPAFRRDIWMKLGGLDKRFHGTFCEMDMQIRFYEYGMNPFITPDCWIEELDKLEGVFKEEGWNDPNHLNCSLMFKHYTTAKNLILSLWTKDGKISKTRMSSVESFTDEELKT